MEEAGLEPCDLPRARRTRYQLRYSPRLWVLTGCPVVRTDVGEPGHTPGVRTSPAALVLALTITLAGCGGEAAGENYPSNVGVLVDGILEAGVCDAVTGGETAPDASSADRMWVCDDSETSLRISFYSGPVAAANWVAKSQVIDLCGRLTAPPDMDFPDYGELLYEDASVYGLLEDIEAVQETTGGEVFTRHDPFPSLADPAAVEPSSGCGDLDIYPQSWEQYRSAFEYYQ